MFHGANSLLFEKAKQLRNKLTAAETVLWMHLKKGINGLKFRRQHPFGIYIADFYCHKIKLVIEVDGSIHNDPEIRKADEIRQKDIEEMGYMVIRFKNEEIMADVEAVMKKIIEIVAQLEQYREVKRPDK